jgi:hypothetical protein
MKAIAQSVKSALHQRSTLVFFLLKYVLVPLEASQMLFRKFLPV